MIMSKDWDKAYSDNQTPWDKGAASPALEEWLQREEGALLGKGLVLGCGLGHDVRLLAKYSKEVEGIDFSKTAISKRLFSMGLTDSEYDSPTFKGKQKFTIHI